MKSPKPAHSLFNLSQVQWIPRYSGFNIFRFTYLSIFTSGRFTCLWIFFVQHIKHSKENPSWGAEILGHYVTSGTIGLRLQISKSRSTIYLPWDWLATPPRLEIKKTIDASFCGGAKMVSTVRTNVILGVWTNPIGSFKCFYKSSQRFVDISCSWAYFCKLFFLSLCFTVLVVGLSYSGLII